MVKLERQHRHRKGHRMVLENSAHQPTVESSQVVCLLGIAHSLICNLSVNGDPDTILMNKVAVTTLALGAHAVLVEIVSAVPGSLGLAAHLVESVGMGSVRRDVVDVSAAEASAGGVVVGHGRETVGGGSAAG